MTKKIIFLSQNSEDSRAAEEIFRNQANQSELAWEAVSGSIAQVQQLDSEAAMIVFVEPTSAPNTIPTLKIPTEVWKYSEAQDVTETLNKNVANLIVRLILKGGKRQPLTNTSAPTQQTSVQVSKAAAQAAVRVGLESKGRAGKKVSVITGLPLSDSAFEDLTTKLKRSCGTGGTYKDQQIEIQGDHREKLMSELQKLGYKPKRTGG